MDKKKKKIKEYQFLYLKTYFLCMEKEYRGEIKKIVQKMKDNTGVFKSGTEKNSQGHIHNQKIIYFLKDHTQPNTNIIQK